MELLVSQAFNGIAIGAAYALLVTGLNLLLLIRRIFQWSFAHIVVLSMCVLWMVLDNYSGSVVTGIAIASSAAIGTSIALNLVTEPMFRPMVRRGLYMEAFILAIGFGIVLTDVMSKYVNHGSPVMFPSYLTGAGSFDVGNFSFSLAKILTIAISILSMFALFRFLNRTQYGRSFRAMAQEPYKAALLGIPITRTGILGFTVAGIIGGISAILLSMAIGYAYPALPNILAVKGLAVVLVAGPGNLIGGLITAFSLGVAEVMTGTYISGDWMQAIVFSVMLAIILAKPSGIFGARV